ncbi:MAG: DEAD/DEAH box helicase family protein [Microbacteriaceae bacterium]|nr:DEAD/DEAH box helicase family protein [Microbacteriaceae bacterium]
MVDEAPNPDFLLVSEAADYLGVSTQTLRRWDRDGRLVAVRRPENGYRYYRRSDLEPFRLEYRRAADAVEDGGEIFLTANANIEANDRLREPQRDAHRSVREHFQTSDEPAVIVIPVGCGKTGVMATLPFGIAEGRVLVITPNLTIRKGVTDALDIASRECFWARTRVLSDFTAGPWTAVLDGPTANLNDCIESHFVVTNIQQLASQADRWLPQFPPDFFDMILVDEGHHAAAPSWQKVFRRFPNAKVVSMTATPFRSDQQPLQGEVIYRYSFARAMVNGFIKQVHSRSVAPQEVYFTYRDDTRRHTLDEVLQLREEQWFRRGVALSPECNRHIAEASINRCEALRAQTGLAHQVIASACSVDHARQVRAIYQELGYRAAEIHSDMDPDEQEAVLERLRIGQLDCIVQVQMLGEGFDHPRLSVAAVFRPFRSLAPYIQFIGRVMRVVVQNEPSHPDNTAYVVSHVGLNNEARWSEFRELDLDEQQLVQSWLRGEEDAEPEGEGEGTPRRFDGGMLVNDEIISHFVDNEYLDPEDDRVLDQMLAQALAGGFTLGDIVTREQLRERLRAQRSDRAADTPQPLPITPQRRRRAARGRLAERSNSVVARVLQDLGLSRAGRDIARVGLGQGGGSNVQAVIRLLNREINEHLGIGSGARGTLTAQQTEQALAELDNLGDAVRDRIRTKIERSR